MTRVLENIVSCLKDTVRFKAEGNPDYNNGANPIDSDLQGPATARLIYHPLITETNMRAIAPDFSAYTFPAWDIATTYAQGDQVTKNGKLYKSLIAANTGNDPETSTTEWEMVSLFSNWLSEMRDDAIRDVVTTILNKKRDNRQTKSLLDRAVLYDRVARNNEYITKRGRLVGFEIELLNANSLQMVVQKIGTQFTELQTGLTLYLYHSSQNTPVQTISVDITKKVGLEWADKETIMGYNQFGGGSWYLVYKEDDLTGQAVNARHYFGRGPCRSCNHSHYEAWKNWTQYTAIRSISLEAGEFDAVGNTMFDIADISYHPHYTWGLNLQWTVECDLATVICENKQLFNEPVSQQIIVNLLKEMANNTRSNVISEKTRELARIAIANSDLGGENELTKLQEALEGTHFEFSDLQSATCMPCLPRKGVKFKSVGSGGSFTYAYHR